MLITPRTLFKLVEYFQSKDIERLQAEYDAGVKNKIDKKRKRGIEICDGGMAKYSKDSVETFNGPVDKLYQLAYVVLREDDDDEEDRLKFRGRVYDTQGLPEDGYYLLNTRNDSLLGPLTDADFKPRRIEPISRRPKHNQYKRK